MVRRVLALLSARLRSQLGGELVPFAALLSQGALVAGLCLVVRDELGPWGYALFALSAAAALVALTLLGEFGSLLVADPASEWSETLPARDWERRAAHGGAVLFLLASLTLGLLTPAALLAPSSMDLGMRLSLIVAGLGQALTLGAALLVVQVLLGERIQGLLLLLQTGLVVGAVSGLLMAPAVAPAILQLEAGELDGFSALGNFPPAWFAAAVSPGPVELTLPAAPWLVAGALLAIALLALLPPARRSRARHELPLLSRLLAPARGLASRFWVRPAERASFDLVIDALPLEREFIVRTYPMLGLPLAFLVAGTRGEGSEGIRDLLALLLFTPAVYLPILLAHVPVTSSPEARWLLETAPVSRADVERGAIKALAVRFLLPLYLVLGGLAWYLADGAFALKLALPGALLSMIALRILYSRCVVGLPLSTAPDEITVHHDWTGLLLGLAGGLTVLALVVQRIFTQPLQIAGLVGVLLGVEIALEVSHGGRGRPTT